MKKILFLLGGSDLEMNEIKELLIRYSEEKNFDFIDKNLKWGAKLSDYKTELEGSKKKYSKIYGIELTKDIETPDNYFEIDHHNQNECKPSSLEQIAKILDIDLTREQQLIAANDKAYISAMKSLCATDEEIKKIRESDKKFQGVTDEDEKLADKSISEFKKERNGVTIVKALTDKFSTITDKLYGKAKKLIIYNDKTLLYSGENRNKLVEEFSKFVDEQKAYYGGGEYGFFGFVNNALSKSEIENTIEKIEELVNAEKNNPVSTHIFLFPFTYTNETNSTNQKNDNFNNFIQQINGEFEESKSFKFDKVEARNEACNEENYNEYVYFYDFVRKAIYEEESSDNNNALLKHFKYKLGDNPKYEIYVKDKNPIILDINSIELTIYNTGVGVLSFHLSYFTNEQDDNKIFENVLKINQYGRRIFPAFLGKESDRLAKPKNSNLACKLVLKIGEKTIEEDYSYFNSDDINQLINEIRKNKIKSKIIEELFSRNLHIAPVIDDRMFVISWHKNDLLSNELKSKEKENYIYLSSKKWYSYIFVDEDTEYPYCQNSEMLKDLIKKHTYERFTDYGTFYGISRYSFVCLTNSNSFNDDVIKTHINTMYYKLVLLCLVQRASILNFSNEVTAISKDIDKADSLDRIEDLTENYLKFVNSLYFREVTAQEQGIELYDKMQEIMRIERDIKDLNREIDELYQHSKFKEDRVQTKQINKLTILGSVLLIPTLITSYLGMNIFDANKGLITSWIYYIIFIILLFLLSFLAYCAFSNKGKLIKKNKVPNILQRLKACFEIKDENYNQTLIIMIVILTLFLMVSVIFFF